MILYIPKYISLCLEYLEVPNGPHNFLDDFPILKLFKRTHITLFGQDALDIVDKDLIKKLVREDTEISNEQKEEIIELNKSKEPMTKIEKRIYMNIISYLNSNIKKENNKYYIKVKSVASCFTKSLYSKKLRKKDIFQENKNNEKIINNIFFKFLEFEEGETLNIIYNIPLIF